ncbi:hypothetical protein D3C78_1452010 [compost metagenome]
MNLIAGRKALAVEQLGFLQQILLRLDLSIGDVQPRLQPAGSDVEIRGLCGNDQSCSRDACL